MKLIFNIHYRTNWGESVYISGDTVALGGNDLSRAVRLEHESDGKWSVEVEICDTAGDFTYRYV